MHDVQRDDTAMNANVDSFMVCMAFSVIVLISSGSVWIALDSFGVEDICISPRGKYTKMCVPMFFIRQ